jgi:6,7-dimethyl-8-ribityllumazine synthase
LIFPRRKANVSDAKAELSLSRGAGRGLKVALAVAAFNRPFTSRLLKGAQGRLKRLGASSRASWVPGAFELGFTCKELASSGSFDAVIALGAVIRGETSHYDLVCRAAADGVLRAGMDSGVPVIFGVITCDSEAQALERCSGGDKDAGLHAAEAAVAMALLSRELRHGR